MLVAGPIVNLPSLLILARETPPKVAVPLALGVWLLAAFAGLSVSALVKRLTRRAGSPSPQGPRTGLSELTLSSELAELKGPQTQLAASCRWNNPGDRDFR
jgi:hypothetical protein